MKVRIIQDENDYFYLEVKCCWWWVALSAPMGLTPIARGRSYPVLRYPTLKMAHDAANEMSRPTLHKIVQRLP